MKYKSSQRTPDLGKLLKSAEMRQVVMNAAEHGANAVRAVVPRDSGNLANSIHVEFSSDNGGPKADRVEALIIADAPYAAAVQFGSSHNKAQPFLEAGIDAIEGGS